MTTMHTDTEAFEALADRCVLGEWDLVLLALDDEELSLGYGVEPVPVGDLADLEAIEDGMDFDQADPTEDLPDMLAGYWYQGAGGHNEAWSAAD